MEAERYSITIEKKSNFQIVNLKEIVAYKDLLYFLSIRSIKARYAQSVLGIGWAVLQPLFTMLIFTIVFGGLAKINSEGVPYALFSFSGLVAWNYFSGALSDASNSLLSNTGMLSKVYFPRLVLPLSSLISKTIDFVIGLIVMALLMVGYKFMPTAQLLYFPFIVFLLLLASFGLSVLLAAWSVQFRDVKYALSFILQILMYAAPVVYPLSAVPEKYRLLYAINPMVGVVEGFRASILGVNSMPWRELGIGSITSLLALVFGLYIFSKLEKTFADVV